MSDVFYIHHFGEQLGPWSKDQVVKKIQSKDINITDYVYDEDHKEWVLICDSNHFAEYFKTLNNHFSNLIPGSKSDLNHPAEFSDNNSDDVKNSNNQKKNKKSNNGKADSEGRNIEEGQVHEFVDSKQMDQAWYILKNENKFGPYSFLDLVKMLQTKQLMEYDFIFKDGMPGWKTVSEVEEFSADKIRDLKKSGLAEIGELFFRRRYMRVEYGASIVIHNNKSVWKGKGLEISPGGAGFLLEKTSLSNGQINGNVSAGDNLFLHFKAGDGVPPFNAVCTVVSVTSVSDLQFKLGVKFTNISQNVQQSIKTMTDNHKQKTAA